jgi:hypothetical protein
MSTGELIVTQFTGPNRNQYLTNLFRLNDDSPKSDKRQRKENTVPIILSGKHTELTLTVLIKQNTTKLIQVHSLDIQFTLIYEFKTNVVDYDVQIMKVDDPEKDNSEPISVYVTRNDS